MLPSGARAGWDAVRPEGTAWRGSLEVTTGQLDYEWGHLVGKLALRSPDWLAAIRSADPSVDQGPPATHPLFRSVEGPVAEWEIV